MDREVASTCSVTEALTKQLRPSSKVPNSAGCAPSNAHHTLCLKSHRRDGPIRSQLSIPVVDVFDFSRQPLSLIKIKIGAPARHEFLMRPLLDDFSRAHVNDEI